MARLKRPKAPSVQPPATQNLVKTSDLLYSLTLKTKNQLKTKQCWQFQIISNLIPFRNLNLMFALGIVVRTLITAINSTVAGESEFMLNCQIVVKRIAESVSTLSKSTHHFHNQDCQTSRYRWRQCSCASWWPTQTQKPHFGEGLPSKKCKSMRVWIFWN